MNTSPDGQSLVPLLYNQSFLTYKAAEKSKMHWTTSDWPWTRNRQQYTPNTCPMDPKFHLIRFTNIHFRDIRNAPNDLRMTLNT